MCVKQLRENNNIVNINTIEVSKLTKFSIYYSLNVDERIFEFHNSDIKLFFVSINNEEKLMFIFNQFVKLRRQEIRTTKI